MHRMAAKKEYNQSWVGNCFPIPWQFSWFQKLSHCISEENKENHVAEKWEPSLPPGIPDNWWLGLWPKRLRFRLTGHSGHCPSIPKGTTRETQISWFYAIWQSSKQEESLASCLIPQSPLHQSSTKGTEQEWGSVPVVSDTLCSFPFPPGTLH